MIKNLDYYLSACQLGITVTSLGLGWLGEPTLINITPVIRSDPLARPVNDNNIIYCFIYYCDLFTCSTR